MNNWLPSLNSLRAFEVVSRHLNYHSAAKELNVTPAAVKQLVSKLEDAIGCKLLERKGRKIFLTDTGINCCSELSFGFESLLLAVEKMRRADVKKQLIVTVETSFSTTWLVPKLDQFRARYPEIDVLIDSNQHIADLTKESVDIAIRYGVERESNMFVHRLFADQIFPACSPALIKGASKLRTLEDLNSVPLIHWDMSQLDWARTTRTLFSWEKWLEQTNEHHINTDRGLYFSDYGQAVQAAIAGQGVFLASWPILREPIAAGVLVCPFEEKIVTDVGYDLVTTPRAKKQPEVNAFLEWIVEMAESEGSHKVSNYEKYTQHSLM